jgi:hypothetical protein
MIRKPYSSIITPSIVFTETITYQGGFFKNYQSVNPGRAINFEYEPMPFANEQAITASTAD